MTPDDAEIERAVREAKKAVSFCDSAHRERPCWRPDCKKSRVLLALHAERQEMRIVFDGPPSHESGRFIEVEDASGKGIKVGQWHDRGDGYWELRLPSVSEAFSRGWKAACLKVAEWCEATASVSAVKYGLERAASHARALADEPKEG